MLCPLGPLILSAPPPQWARCTHHFTVGREQTVARVQAGRGDLLQDSLAGGDHGTAAVVADGPRGRHLAARRLAVPDPCKTPPALASPSGTGEVSRGCADPLGQVPVRGTLQPSHGVWHKDADVHRLLNDTREGQTGARALKSVSLPPAPLPSSSPTPSPEAAVSSSQIHGSH